MNPLKEKKEQKTKAILKGKMGQKIGMVTLRVQLMNAEQEQRLSTAVDALLMEFVRQEIGRAKQP